MRLKSIILHLHWMIIFILPIFLSACAMETTQPLPDGIPKDNIIFTPHGDLSHTTYQGPTLGFINDNGTNEVLYTFEIFQGAGSNFGMPLSNKLANEPHWSKSGDMLAFSVGGIPPDIRIIDSQGRMYGRKCLDLDEDSTFDTRGNILGEITKFSPLYPKYKDQITPGTSLIARYDLKTCTVAGTFSVPVPFGSDVWDVNEAENGLLTFYYYENLMYKFMIFNLVTHDFTTILGRNPSLNKTGTLLAYFNPDGNLMIRDTKSSLEKTMIHVTGELDYVHMPGWSPDNQWLVYNTPDGKIYKVNRETGENIYITDGWAPDWRP
jgi:hypothetical protein